MMPGDPGQRRSSCPGCTGGPGESQRLSEPQPLTSRVTVPSGHELSWAQAVWVPGKGMVRHGHQPMALARAFLRASESLGSIKDSCGHPPWLLLFLLLWGPVSSPSTKIPEMPPPPGSLP